MHKSGFTVSVFQSTRYGGLVRPQNPMYIERVMWTIVVILLIMWLLGMLTSTTVGGLLHILLVVAVVIFVVNLLRSRRSLD